MIVLCIVLGMAVIFFLTLLLCFLMTFYSKTRTTKYLEKYKLPIGKAYLKYEKILVGAMKEVRGISCENVEITSYDGLTLRGRYFEFKKNAPVELMMHGYRGNSETDLSIGVLRARELCHNVLIVDHRAAGYSDGHIITFGVKESKDCMTWIDFIIKKFGDSVKILLTGISMGAATVMIVAGRDDLPSNVVGVVADCGYTSAEDVIKKVISQMHLPTKLFYPLIYLGAKLFGGFSIKDASPLEAMKKCTLPIVFFHSDTDNFVPASMSRANYETCISGKKYIHISSTGEHGLCYLMDKEGYLNTLIKLKEDCGL